MSQGKILAKQAGMSRRTFLKTSGGLIAMSVVGMGAKQATAAPEGSTPGIASQRYEGVTKVTGGKIYARDFNAKDLHLSHGWPQHQWYAMYLRALTVTREFQGVDLSSLDPSIFPTKVVLGNDFATGMTTPPLTAKRDRIVDEEIALAVEAAQQEAITTGSQLDLPPHVVEFPLVVEPGNRPDYLGQAVALLLFDDLKKFRAAKRQMQFNDADYQVYGPEIGPDPDDPQVFQPETLYVKEVTEDANFSYYLSNRQDYSNDAPGHIDSINAYVSDTPGLITHSFGADMRAMDPMFMEPESGLVWFDTANKSLNLLLGTQSPDHDLTGVCTMYGECGSTNAVEQATLISCYPGGGFGGRDSSPFTLMLALAADFAEGNPVKLEYDRFEQFRVGLKRHACDLTGALSVTADQELKVIQMDMTFDGGGRKNLSPYVAQLACLCAGGSYDVPMANIAGKATHSENVSGGSQRGFGGPQAFFAIETAIDDICIDQHWDPVEFRLNNVVVEGDTTVIGGPIQQELRLAEMLEVARDHPLWADRYEIQEGFAQRGKIYGTGMAMSLQAYGTSGDGVVAAVKLMDDGTWQIESDAVDMGNGSATTLGVVVGPILGQNADTVVMGGHWLFGDTQLKVDGNICPADCIGPDGKNKFTGDTCDRTWEDSPGYTRRDVMSSSACLTGLHQVHVMQQAALAAMAQIVLPAAQEMWGVYGVTERDVEWVDGMLVLDGYEPLSLPQISDFVYSNGDEFATGVVVHGYFQETWVSGEYPTPIGLRSYDVDGLALYYAGRLETTQVLRQSVVPMDCRSTRESRYVWAPCVNVVGLTVDRDSGEVEVQNVLSVLNAGRIHVPELVSGQSQGGVAMAMGWTLYEDMPPGMAGPANGTWNLNTYHVPRYADVPLATEYAQGGRSQELVIMPETPGDNGQGRGIAEAVMCSIAPAISNALKEATGVRFNSIPITPEKIREGLKT